MMTEAQLLLIMPRCPIAQRTAYLQYLCEAMKEGNLTTVTRASAFLGQLAVESGELRYFEEIADGSAYEGRGDLGNLSPGDGRRYKGRGPIQLTGRKNYRAAGQALGLDLESNPDVAARPEVGFRVAVWYWVSRKLNEKADALDFVGITHAINGGLTHHEKRQAYYYKALEVLGTWAKLV